jgi:hypothetical protein
MSTELPEIIKRALVETVTDIGQLSKAELYQLNKYVKRGWLSKGKGGPFPMLKTVYACPGFDFKASRDRYIEQAIAAYEIEKRLRVNGYFDVSSPNYGKSLSAMLQAKPVREGKL